MEGTRGRVWGARGVIGHGNHCRMGRGEDGWLGSVSIFDGSRVVLMCLWLCACVHVLEQDWCQRVRGQGRYKGT